VNAILAELNAMPAPQAEAAFLACCGSTAWAQAMTARRPYGADVELYTVAEERWWRLGPDDWLEAFAAHPKIGERKAAAGSTSGRSPAENGWSAQEQSGIAAAAPAVREELAAGNAEYQQRFGYIFIVCATGKTAQQMLALLRQRLQNDAATELRIAAGEQAKITRLRLGKFLTG
jgi:2-oxo-4-hydroxy-4-carboxy-5-ureidoimidazoline decarboxylase